VNPCSSISTCVPAALQKVVQSGKARYIGITGYALDALRTVLDTSDVRIDTVLSYCRYASYCGLDRNYPGMPSFSFQRACPDNGVSVVERMFSMEASVPATSASSRCLFFV
jgi:aryl-alcohol dehydrogenase-like predicted oxidoreductase